MGNIAKHRYCRLFATDRAKPWLSIKLTFMIGHYSNLARSHARVYTLLASSQQTTIALISRTNRSRSKSCDFFFFFFFDLSDGDETPKTRRSRGSRPTFGNKSWKIKGECWFNQWSIPFGLIFTADFPDTQFYGNQSSTAEGQKKKKNWWKILAKLRAKTIRFRVGRSVCGLSGLIDDFYVFIRMILSGEIWHGGYLRR